MTFRMEDGTLINTEKASERWEEQRVSNGSNMISRATGTQWHHETLLKSRKGRFYKLCQSDWQGTQDHCEWIDEREAVRWLMVNDHEVPEALRHLIEEIEE